MAMEVRRTIADAHDQAILCVAYNAQRREIFTGSQDATIKAWASEAGTLERTLVEPGRATAHAGWVTGLAFAPEVRVLFSCSIDGRILAWSFKGELLQKEKVGGKDLSEVAAKGPNGPLYCLAWDARRGHVVAGANGAIFVYSVIVDGSEVFSAREGRIIRFHSVLRDAHGEEPVRGILTTESGKVYSCGYDRSICIWDSDSFSLERTEVGLNDKKKKGKKAEAEQEGTLRKIHEVKNCHDGAISAVTFDPDNNWLITGGFDRVVRIWAGDGKPVASIDSFNDTLTGIAYVPATKTLWMSANSAHPLVYDPRSAQDVTEYMLQEATSALAQREAKERTQRLFRIQQTGELVASTNTRQLVLYRYNPYGACSILRGHSDWVEVLSHCCHRKLAADGTEEVAMSLLSAGADATLRRWEPSSRMNAYLYATADVHRGHKGAVLCALYAEAIGAFVTGGEDATIRLWVQANDSGAEERAEAAAAKEEEEGEEEEEEEAAVPAAERGVEKVTVLREHSDRVTGLACAGSQLVSVSWDLSVCVHTLDEKVGISATTHTMQMAHDDYILACALAPELPPDGDKPYVPPTLATASADQGVKLWDMSNDVLPADDPTVPDGRKGKRLVGVLAGHTADVSHLKWLHRHRMWVSGSEDNTLRLWDAGTRLQTQQDEFASMGGITALAVDERHGYLLIASMDCAVRVYDPLASEVVQVHRGHSDAVRCILHVPEKDQYITASWDHTIRVWRAHAAGRRKGDGAASPTRRGASPTRAAAASPEAGGAEAEEERPLTFAERNPLVMPKCISGFEKKAGADKFLKKTMEGVEQTKRKKKHADDDIAAKAVTGLAADLEKLELSLKTKYDDAAPKGGGRAGGAGARGGLARAPTRSVRGSVKR